MKNTPAGLKTRMQQLELFSKPAKYAKPAKHEPNEYIVLGQWGLAHLAKCAVLMGSPQSNRDVAKGPRRTSGHREPTFSSKWMPPADSDE